MSEAVLSGGLIRLEGAAWRASVGRGGIRPDKREGDGATPAGLLPLRRVFYRADRVTRPLASVPIEAMGPDDGWCDDPGDGQYNQWVRLPHAARHEQLWREDSLYDVVGVLGWNDRPPVHGRGSAIFLHLAAPDWRPTDGCIAMAGADLQALLGAGVSAIRVELA